ncbi:MAG: 4Fe-4S dicluster domain-containing protein [Gammaproteobacteria bacterium]|nr:4Fe-4S dicluster domain-containing protein [Gammaproteobacteria bacterium]
MQDVRFLPRQAFDVLLEALRQAGYRVVGPTVENGAVQYRDLAGAAQLPAGWTDDQAPGHYRLTRVESARCFAWATGPQALKPYLFGAREVLWEVSRDAQGALSFAAPPAEQQPLAVIGARACDIAALSLQDRHFLETIHDPYYAARREGLFIVAVHCAYPADTCFCASTGDGPRAERGFDLALSELDDGYLIETGSDRGQAIAAKLPLHDASADQRTLAEHETDEAARRQFRRLPARNLRDGLLKRLDHPRWDDVAARCLACGNCTSVCPTCFCHAEQDAPALDGTSSHHLREWDSCFSLDHSYLHGFVVRSTTQHRYRQWLTHKLGSWHDQYGRSGCVGCGRCITWCPVGIDLTAEIAAICTTPSGDLA